MNPPFAGLHCDGGPVHQDRSGAQQHTARAGARRLLVPYAFFQLFGGILGDKFGPRKVLTAVGLLWALATLFTGFATGLVTLFAARLALGFGEGASFPTATTAMAKWLPIERRAFGQGVTHAFARIGNAVAPLAVAGLIALWNWRLAFIVFGVISLSDGRLGVLLPRPARRPPEDDRRGAGGADHRPAARRPSPGAVEEAVRPDSAGHVRRLLLRVDAVGLPDLDPVLLPRELRPRAEKIRAVLGAGAGRWRGRRHGRVASCPTTC